LGDIRGEVRHPWLIAKTPRGSPQHQNEELLDKMEAMIQDAVAVIPDDSSVDAGSHDHSASAEMYRELLMFCRSEVSIALLGQNQSTEASSTRASAMAGLEVAREIRDGDARMCEATLNQMLRWIVDLNEGTEAPSPTVELFEEEQVNKEQAERDDLLTARVSFSQYWKRTYKLQEEILKRWQRCSCPMLLELPSPKPLAPLH
jgi:phage gp29-like protein